MEFNKMAVVNSRSLTQPVTRTRDDYDDDDVDGSSVVATVNQTDRRQTAAVAQTRSPSLLDLHNITIPTMPTSTTPHTLMIFIDCRFHFRVVIIFPPRSSYIIIASSCVQIILCRGIIPRDAAGPDDQIFLGIHDRRRRLGNR